MTDYPSPDMAEVELVDVLRALGDPGRLQIVQQLADGKPRPKTLDGLGPGPLEVDHVAPLPHPARVRAHAHDRARPHACHPAPQDELAEKFPGLIDAVLADPPK